MSYFTMNSLQALNDCYMSGPDCKPSIAPMLSSNNGLYSLNANPNLPLNCSTPGVSTPAITKEGYQCSCNNTRRNDMSYNDDEAE